VTDIKRILCFGDSLTWGWVGVQHAVPTTRFPLAQRWTGVMLAELGAGFELVEEGLNARTTAFDDPIDSRLNGSAYLPTCLASHYPLDVVILMLGTNDSKPYFRKTPLEIAAGMGKLIGQVQGSGGGIGTTYPAPSVLVVAPPPVVEIPDPWFDNLFKGSQETMRQLAEHYKNVAGFYKVEFLNAGDHVSAEGIDGIHLTAQNNVDLGLALAAKVRTILL
jgi:lysophospholipase L1-like esterase